ncbi:MAG: hypothetical protein ACJ8F7_21625 [Gemmataceae bacterium]
MFRKIALTGLTVLGLALPLGLTATADAHEPRPYEHEHHRRDFEVNYRRNCDSPWRCYGRFDGEREADRAAEHLRHQHFEVRVEHCR